MSSKSAEVIVIGAGTMGAAAAWALARRGVDVIAIEQFGYYNKMASHGGHTRIFRHCYFEGEKYVPWTLEADRLFSELQDRTGLELQIRVGCLDIGTPENGHAKLARATAIEHNLPYEMLTGKDVNERFPGWNVPEDFEACLDPDGGVLRVENVFTAFRREIDAAGGRIVENQKVLGWEATDDGVTVTTADGVYTGKQLIITAGAWAGKVLSDLHLPLQVTRKPVMWFEVDDMNTFAPRNFPPFIIDCDIQHFYGLPAVAPDSLKMGIHSDMNVVDPDNFQREVQPEDMVPEFVEFIGSMLKGAHARTSMTSMCMYTMTPDEDFIIDRHPQHANVAIAAGFSGHSFKFATVIGEHLADLATDPSVAGKPAFAVGRFS
ncbi:MAG: N-methyl-L-tryptophan oxidase [Thermomicrobiales bacterium]|nr:N-methyl-L-tryptophan oxidase [Thermomicrobiales bacterium]MCO5224563.1 N-methyl-L-tryptophan oxidase [Thermomicrobiales bacterium]MCO5227325.1 N-methyl-L-tryptophan oxidase [Thermomicrobiales bacterium]